MKSKIIIAACAATMLAGTSEAQSLQSREEAVATIVSNNQRLKQLWAEHQSMTTAAAGEARSLEGTEVEFEQLWGRSNAKKWNLGVSQSFDWPGVYGKRKAAASAQETAYKWLYEAERNATAQQAKEAITGAVYAQQKLNLQREVSANLAQLREYIEKGYSDGQLTILDVKKVKLEQFKTACAVSDAEQELRSYTSELASLNGGASVEVDLGSYYPEPLKDEEEYLMLARDNNAVVNAAIEDTHAARANAEAARLSRYPGFSVGFRHAYEEEIHYNGFSVGLTLPIFSRSKARQAAELEAQSFSFAANEAVAQAQSAVRGLYADAMKRRALLEGLSEATLSDNYPELLQMAYKGGQINVITYLEELNYYIAAREDYLRAEYSYQLDLVRLNRWN